MSVTSFVSTNSSMGNMSSMSCLRVPAAATRGAGGPVSPSVASVVTSPGGHDLSDATTATPRARPELLSDSSCTPVPDAAQQTEARRLAQQEFMEMYTTKEQLGSGSSCTVHRVVDDNGDSYALKVMQVQQRRLFGNEVAFLSMLKDVRGVINLHRHLDSDFGCYLVTDLGHRDLFRLVKDRGPLDEARLRQVMAALLQTMKTLHKHGVIHLDIKPENMVVTYDDPTYPKLIDFGHALLLRDEQACRVGGGTVYYRAPERMAHPTLLGWHFKAADMWSLGVSCYELLTGKRCFYGKTKKVVKAKVLRGEWHWPTADGCHVSPECADFITALLTVDPRARLTAVQALKHPWITGRQSSRQDCKSTA